MRNRRIFRPVSPRKTQQAGNHHWTLKDCSHSTLLGMTMMADRVSFWYFSARKPRHHRYYRLTLTVAVWVMEYGKFNFLAIIQNGTARLQDLEKYFQKILHEFYKRYHFAPSSVFICTCYQLIINFPL